MALHFDPCLIIVITHNEAMINVNIYLTNVIFMESEIQCPFVDLSTLKGLTGVPRLQVIVE